MALTNEDLLAISQLLDSKLQPIKSDIQELKLDTQQLKTEVQQLKQDVQQLKTEVQQLKQDNQEIKEHIATIKIHIENTTDKNIKLIAEGHTDLTRKLDDALKVENEKELLLIRVSYLEAEVKQIKERLSQIA